MRMKTKMPRGWFEVNIDTYIDCMIQGGGDSPSFETNLNKLCILTEDGSWEEKPYIEVNKVIRENTWISENPKEVKVKDIVGDYKLKPFETLTLSEWLDLENFILNKQYGKILGLVYRRHLEDNWGHITLEPYKYKVDERYSELAALNCLELIGAFNHIYTYRAKVLDSYRDIFNPSTEDDDLLDEKDKEGLSDIEIKEIEKEIADDKLKQDYVWQKIIDDISGGDWSRAPKILELPHLFVFNMMRMKKIFK